MSVPVDQLIAALRAQQQAIQAPVAPAVDTAGIQRDLLSAQRQNSLAEALLAQSQQPLPQFAGGINVLANLAQQFAGNRIGKRADKLAAGALDRQAQADAARKAFDAQSSDAASRRDAIQRRIDQLELARQSGIDPSRLGELAVTGKLGAVEKAPDAVRTLQALRDDPGLAAVDRQRKAAAATRVNVSQPGVSAFDKELGRADAQTFVKLRDNAQSSAQTLARVDDVEAILQGVQTGRVNEALARAGQIFGTDAGASFQALRGAIQPLVLSEVKKLGSGNGITDADREFIIKGMPGFGNDPRANATVLRILRTGALVDQEVFKAAQDTLQRTGTLREFSPASVIAEAAPRIRQQLEAEAGGTLASPDRPAPRQAPPPGVIEGEGEFQGFRIRAGG